MMKRIKDMTEEEINAEFDLEYKRTWLKWRRMKRVQAWVTLIVCVPIIIILLMFIAGLILAMFAV